MANNKIAYGIAKSLGIDTTGMSPHQVWQLINEKRVANNPDGQSVGIVDLSTQTQENEKKKQYIKKSTEKFKPKPDEIVEKNSPQFSEQLTRRCKWLIQMLEKKYGVDTSSINWSHGVFVDPDECKKHNSRGIAMSNGHICVMSEDIGDDVLIHELLHLVSQSNFKGQLKEFENLEEATTDLFAYEICKSEHVEYTGGYPQLRSILSEINHRASVAETDYVFAKALFSIPANKREDALKKAISAAPKRPYDMFYYSQSLEEKLQMLKNIKIHD